MSFDDIEAEIAMMLRQMADRPGDRQELEILLHQKLNELKAFGMPLPQDLVELEAALDFELTSETRRAARHDQKVRR